jgi:SpoIID/LytB domain protein
MPDTVSFQGHGWGHGRGMGQWGAYGYATGSHWTWQQITDHYYQGSTAGDVGTRSLSVALTQLSPTSLLGTGTAYPDATVLLQRGTLRYVTPDGVSHPVLGQALRLERTGPSAWASWVAPGCAGPWTPGPAVSGASIKTLPAVSGATSVQDTLAVCEPSQTGFERHVIGELRAVDIGSGQALVNVLPVESYLQSVVPREMPASWADAANGAGMAALQAQAVAARSYGLGSHRYSYADTCDSSCQSYPGQWIVQGGTTSTVVDARSNQAISSTAGQVRLLPGNVIAATEFSASTGGYTAGGVFTAVPDDGDAVAGNPNHTWTASIARTAIEQRYGKGTLQAIDITGRNGLGDMGGRVTSMTLVFSGGSVNLSGDDFRSAFGLESNWFQVTNNCAAASSPSPPFPSITAMVTQQYHDVLARDPDSQAARWVDAIACGRTTPEAVVTAFFTSPEADAVFGQVVRLYLGVLGRVPDLGGAFGWQKYVAAGMTPQQLAANFANSREFRSVHNPPSNRDFVSEMYVQMFGRTADPGGLQMWTNWLATHTRGDLVYQFSIAREFHQRWDVRAMVHEGYLAMLRRVADPAGYDAWYSLVVKSGGSPAPLVHGLYTSPEYRLRFS